MKKIDVRQITFRGILQQIFPWIAGQDGQTILSSIDKELQPPLVVTATSTPSLTINVGPSVVANTVNGRNKSITFVNGTIPDIVSASIVFPSASGSNIVIIPTTSAGPQAPVNVLLTLGSGQYVQVLFTVDSSNVITAIFGSPNSPIVPTPANDKLPFAYVTVTNTGGVIQAIAQSNITQITGPQATTASGTSTSSNWTAKAVSVAQGSTELTVNFLSPMPDLSYEVIAIIENQVDSNPMFQKVECTEKTVNGFILQWNSPLDTNNYKVSYIILPKWVPSVETALPNGSSSVVTTLPIPQNGPLYGVMSILQNNSDTYPQFQDVLVTSQNSTSFTSSVNAPSDNAVDVALSVLSPSGQVAIGSGVTSVTANLPIPFGSTGYVVVPVLSNITDASPIYQPMLVTMKSSSQFTVSFNVDTPTSNYYMTFYAISLAP